jgi:hypothetical protein
MTVQFREQKQPLGIHMDADVAVCVHVPRPGYWTWHRRRSGLAGPCEAPEQANHRAANRNVHELLAEPRQQQWRGCMQNLRSA